MTQQPLVIVGGGMAGALLALLLRRHGAAGVMLVESHPLSLPDAPPLTPSFDARSTALSAGTLSVLDDLGLGHSVREHAAAIGTVHVSRQSRLGMTRMSAAEEGVEQLGAVVENRWLGFVLLGALFADEGIEVRAPETLSGIRRQAGGYRASLTRGEEVETPLLIAADGARSKTREWLGISARDHDTGHDALIANLSLKESHKGIAYERFLNDGPLALLPLPDQRMALVWTGPRAQVDQWMALADDEALAQLEAFRDAGRIDFFQVEQLRQKLTAREGRTVKLSTKVDPDLLGGLVVTVGSKRIDGSIRTRLNSLSQAMKA